MTGGAGFIGSNFIHYAAHRGQLPPYGCCPDQDAFAPASRSERVEILNFDKLTYAGNPSYLKGVDGQASYRFRQGDVCDARALEAAVLEFRPDAIVHFAAESHVDRSITAGDEFVRTNVLGTQVLLEAVRRHEVPRTLVVGTDEVYGSVASGSSRESDPLRPSSPYSASKAGGDLLALAHHHTYGTPLLLTRCTNNYGPRQHPEKLLPKAIAKALRNEKIPLYGNGENVRDWIYVKDHCEALWLLLREGRPGETYNIAGRDERRNVDVAQAVLRATGRPASLVEFVKDRPGHDFRYSLDDAKIRSLGWRPRVEFERGLAWTVEWMRAEAASAWA